MTEVRIRPLRRGEYDVLIAQGAFAPDERIELLDGQLIEMTPQSSHHAGVIEALTERLVPALAGRYRVRVQLPLATSDVSEPEPDFAVIAHDQSRDQHPRTALLVIEVADSSLALDLGKKAAAYALANVATYWVIDLRGGHVHVHHDPLDGGYRTKQRLGLDTDLEVFGEHFCLRDLLT